MIQCIICSPNEAKRLKALDGENAKLKRLLADAILDALVPKDLLARKVTLAAIRAAVAHARSAVARWVVDYDDHHPHSALGYLTPSAFASTFTATDDRLCHPDQFRRSTVDHPARQRQTHPRILLSVG